VYTRLLCGIWFLLILCPASVAGASSDEKRIELTVPAAPWTLTLPADDLVLERQQIKPDGRSGYFYMTDDKKHINVSMFIEPVKDCKDSKSCRDMVWKMGNPAWVNPRNVVLSEIGEVSILELMIPSFQGQPIKQQNMYAEFVVEDFWVDLHISKVLYQPAEHELFERIIKSMKFEPKKKSKLDTRNSKLET
jgi:hypothetical protein